MLYSCYVNVQKIELSKSEWNKLFEPYMFFESYKNYLQVDIVAADVNDLRAWKGWVESQLIKLTLMVTYFHFDMLVCDGATMINLNFSSLAIWRYQ